MNRCQSRRARVALGTRERLALAELLSPGSVAGALAPSASLAQESIRREAPKDVILGQMSVVTPPDIQIDGKGDRLSPGSRIRRRARGRPSRARLPASVCVWSLQAATTRPYVLHSP